MKTLTLTEDNYYLLLDVVEWAREYQNRGGDPATSLHFGDAFGGHTIDLGNDYSTCLDDLLKELA